MGDLLRTMLTSCLVAIALSYLAASAMYPLARAVRIYKISAIELDAGFCEGIISVNLDMPLPGPVRRLTVGRER